jgi:hypothetical protein
LQLKKTKSKKDIGKSHNPEDRIRKTEGSLEAVSCEKNRIEEACTMAEAYGDRGKGILVIPAVMPPMTSLSGEIRPVAERSKNHALPRFRFFFSGGLAAGDLSDRRGPARRDGVRSKRKSGDCRCLPAHTDKSSRIQTSFQPLFPAALPPVTFLTGEVQPEGTGCSRSISLSGFMVPAAAEPNRMTLVG